MFRGLTWLVMLTSERNLAHTPTKGLGIFASPEEAAEGLMPATGRGVGAQWLCQSDLTPLMIQGAGLRLQVRSCFNEGMVTNAICAVLFSTLPCSGG